MRAVLIVTSVIGLLATVALVAFVLIMTHGWDGHASLPLPVLAGLAGFLLCSGSSVFGYYRDWYRNAAVPGVLLLGYSATPWLMHRDKLPGIGMLIVAILWAIDACKNHEWNEES